LPSLLIAIAFVFNAGFVRTFDLDACLGFAFSFDQTGLVIFSLQP
jgi:hypothetical protein